MRSTKLVGEDDLRRHVFQRAREKRPAVRERPALRCNPAGTGRRRSPTRDRGRRRPSSVSTGGGPDHTTRPPCPPIAASCRASRCEGKGSKVAASVVKRRPAISIAPPTTFPRSEQLRLGHVVGVGILRHPTAEAFFDGHQVDRVEHQHVHIAVLHVLHLAVMGAEHAEGRRQHRAAVGNRVRHSPVRGVGDTAPRSRSRSSRPATDPV